MADTTRSKQDIEAEIAAARARLADNVADLVNQMHRKAIVQRGIDDARGFAATEFENAKSQVIDDRGNVRTDRVLLIGGAVAGVVTFVLLVRGILKGMRRG